MRRPSEAIRTWCTGCGSPFCCARLKGLRGTPFDVFGYTQERRTERRLVGEFEARLKEILQGLTPANHAVAVGLAALPQKIRGFGHIKERNLTLVRKEEADLLARWRTPDQPMPIAAE